MLFIERFGRAIYWAGITVESGCRLDNAKVILRRKTEPENTSRRRNCRFVDVTSEALFLRPRLIKNYSPHKVRFENGRGHFNADLNGATIRKIAP